jgi:hypothetical protein
LRREAHGKEGVGGFESARGLCKSPAKRGFFCCVYCTVSNVRWYGASRSKTPSERAVSAAGALQNPCTLGDRGILLAIRVRILRAVAASVGRTRVILEHEARDEANQKEAEARVLVVKLEHLVGADRRKPALVVTDGGK